jgi:hypothetical protein
MKNNTTQPKIYSYVRFSTDIQIKGDSLTRQRESISKYSEGKGYELDETLRFEDKGLSGYHGVLCPQARDLFSAGSVALRASELRGGNYLHRALQDIEAEMRTAARELEPALFVEYWGEDIAPQQRIQEWLRRADSYAKGWKPSEMLFVNR